MKVEVTRNVITILVLYVVIIHATVCLISRLSGVDDGTNTGGAGDDSAGKDHRRLPRHRLPKRGTTKHKSLNPRSSLLLLLLSNQRYGLAIVLLDQFFPLYNEYTQDSMSTIEFNV